MRVGTGKQWGPVWADLISPHREGFAGSTRQSLSSAACVEGAGFWPVNQSPVEHCKAEHAPVYCTLQGP